MRAIEIETLEEFDRRAAGATHMSRWQVQGVDLRERSEVLSRLEPSGALLLGCALEPAIERQLVNRGALVFPAIPQVPFNAYRGTLYTPAELYAHLDRGYAATPDARVYAWATKVTHGPVRSRDLRDHLAMSLHDNAIDDALDEFVRDRRLVGVMGGHAVSRTDAAYASAARLGAALAATGVTVATGGGPGAMEAVNLGAGLGHLDGLVDDALATVAAVPDFRPSVEEWAAVALPYADRVGDLSLGIPTWFYGHEPPNVFCTAVAKYFRNALREDILLALCRQGVVFLPGAGGTVQEIFQAACANYYADAADVAPMVLVGRDHWTEQLPAMPLLEAMGKGRDFGASVHLVDDLDSPGAVDEVVGLLGLG